MKKKIFFIVTFLLFTFSLNASNESTFNQFQKFSTRLSMENPPAAYFIVTESHQSVFNTQLNVGNYLSFSPTRAAIINTYEFFSDVLKSDFYVYEQNKKGKITYQSKIYKYDHADFFTPYKKGIVNNKAEVKEIGIVLAGITDGKNNDYKLTTYSARRGIIPIPLNIAFYIKQISDTRVLWSMNATYDKPDFIFTLEDNKLVVRDKKNEIYSTLYREGDSLFLIKKKDTFEYRVNREKSQFEYYKNGKNTGTTLYKTVQ